MRYARDKGVGGSKVEQGEKEEKVNFLGISGPYFLSLMQQRPSHPHHALQQANCRTNSICILAHLSCEPLLPLYSVQFRKSTSSQPLLAV